jgi:hypothetical protein
VGALAHKKYEIDACDHEIATNARKNHNFCTIKPFFVILKDISKSD